MYNKDIEIKDNDIFYYHTKEKDKFINDKDIIGMNLIEKSKYKNEKTINSLKKKSNIVTVIDLAIIFIIFGAFKILNPSEIIKKDYENIHVESEATYFGGKIIYNTSIENITDSKLINKKFIIKYTISYKDSILFQESKERTLLNFKEISLSGDYDTDEFRSKLTKNKILQFNTTIKFEDEDDIILYKKIDIKG